MEPVKTLLITQARIGSTRLPGKVLLKINGTELLKMQLDRLSQCRKVDKIIVATTMRTEDEQIATLGSQWGFEVYKGEEQDVLDRFYQAALPSKPEWIVRITSDCPLIDPELVDAVIAMAQVNDVDYCSNGLIENFPDGQDIEVFKFSVLEQASREAKLKSEREHVTPYIRNHADFNGGQLFKALNFPCAYNFSEIRMTVDEPRDFELMQRLVEELGTEESWLTYTRYIIEKQLNKINNNRIRNEGFLKSLKND